LVRWILSAHPRIAVSRRTDLWPRYAGRYGDLSAPGNLERCLDAMLARKQVAALRPDRRDLVRSFRRGPPTYARLFALLHERFAEDQGKARWGDHSALVERYAPDLFDAYADAVVVHLIRDPRDVHLAIEDRGGHGPGAVGRTTAAWRESAELARRQAVAFRGAYVVIRYEDLVSEPEPTVERLCDAIGEVFHPAMLRLDDVARYRGIRAASPDGSPIDPSHVGGFRTRLDRGALAFIQRAASDLLVHHGYELQPVRATVVERLGWAARRPLDVARMRVWESGRGERSSLAHAS
jgi:hypothetical protein